MTIAIIGASAGIGLLTVERALASGHQVIALSRDTSPIPDHPALTKVKGSATSVADLKGLIIDADAVLVTIGTKKKKGTTLFSDTAQALITAYAETRSKAPLLVITGFGTGESRRYLGLFMKLVIRFFLRDQYTDKTRMEVMLAKGLIRWEIVQPGILTNGSHTGNYRVQSSLHKGMQVGRISRADVADFMINQAENPTFLGQHVAISY
ncbi:NAD(P)H-binding protein [Spirosoma sp. RP8]|uniref:NAD(P)H-binding protein n=1 Tax=Spirosoma liriopis TaxID=2937440 RepID=A0ABT0HR20_9BACT|nr:NAD(P)H-binding protein [Spirosoma liriopis]MCK8494625.1 NAD(P)H-binding protein [Spirosoma liriopis]